MANRTAHDALLAECEPYFLDGVHTIAQFAQRTQELVREAVERQWDPLVQALGFSDDEIALVDYWYPDRLQRAKPTDNVCLGVKLKVSGVFQAVIYRYWVVDEKATGFEAYTWVKGRTRLDRLSKAIDDVPDEPPGPADSWEFDTYDDGTYSISRDLGALELGELDLRLDEFIACYIRVMTKVGGVKRFLSADPSSAG